MKEIGRDYAFGNDSKGPFWFPKGFRKWVSA